MEKYDSNTNYPKILKHRGTFLVKVDYCQNNTWQGRVIWAEENRVEHFRSALELIKLIDGAMAKTMANQTDEAI